jgi:hypothetical protein
VRLQIVPEGSILAVDEPVGSVSFDAASSRTSRTLAFVVRLVLDFVR